MRHGSEKGAPQVEGYVTYLAVKASAGASTQNHTINALVQCELLHEDLGPVEALHAKRTRRLPGVLIKDETLRRMP